MKTLSYREKLIIGLRAKGNSRKEVAKILKMTIDRVRWIEMKAKQKMQKENDEC